MLIVFLALAAIPMIEIALFILIGGQIGVAATLALIVATALAGSVLLRRQGLAALAAAEAEMAAGRPPVAPLIDGLCLIVAALLLLTPGFLTDLLGGVLLVPAGRAVFGRQIWRALARRRAWRHGQPADSGDARPPHRGGGPVTLDGEYRDLDKR